MDVTTSFLSSGVLSFVPEIRNMLASQSLTIILAGRHVGTAKLGDDHSFCWSWHPAITATGREERRRVAHYHRVRREVSWASGRGPNSGIGPHLLHHGA